MITGKNSRATNRKGFIKQRSRVRNYLDAIKAKGCVLCGYSKCLPALEFHHVLSDKKFELSKVKKSLKKVTEEIGKCVCVCANCHREIHANMITGLRHIETIKVKDDGQLGLW